MEMDFGDELDGMFEQQGGWPAGTLGPGCMMAAFRLVMLALKTPAVHHADAASINRSRCYTHGAPCSRALLRLADMLIYAPVLPARPRAAWLPLQMLASCRTSSSPRSRPPPT
jgi:hypothetical protein